MHNNASLATWLKITTASSCCKMTFISLKRCYFHPESDFLFIELSEETVKKQAWSNNELFNQKWTNQDLSENVFELGKM